MGDSATAPLWKECYDNLRILFVNVGSHIVDDKYRESVENMFAESAEKPYLLDDIFILLCLMINNSDMKDLSTSFSIRDFDLGGLNRKLLDLMYDQYMAIPSDKRATDPANIFPECAEIFTECNTTFLIPGPILKAPTIPKSNTEVVNIDVENCINMIFDDRALLDDNYINENYGTLNSKMGVSPKVLERFNFMKIYDPVSSQMKENSSSQMKENSSSQAKGVILDCAVDSTKIYQQLGDKDMRELKNGTTIEKDYNFINYNLFITNWENRRILALMREHHGVPRSINTSAIIGKIKNNIYEKRQRIADAIFDAYKSDNISDEDTLQILISSWAYQEKMSRGVKATDFNKYFNERDVSYNVL